jgi:hypothetical protein
LGLSLATIGRLATVLVVLAAQVGCAVTARAVGRVVQVDGQPWLETSQGDRARLQWRASHASAEGLRYLDGHLVEVEGRGTKRAIDVSRWTLVEGLHGISAWAGVLIADGPRLLLEDAGNGVTVALDRQAAGELLPFVGRPVLIEGYVEGTMGVKVLYWRALFPEDP